MFDILYIYKLVFSTSCLYEINKTMLDQTRTSNYYEVDEIDLCYNYNVFVI